MNDRPDPAGPRAWLGRAQSNLILAEIGLQRGVFLEDLCFQAQQAAEKALKALCIAHGLDYPRTHSLVILLDILEQSLSTPIPAEVKAADVLTQYAVQARYPGWAEGVTEAEYYRALELARQTVTWAAGMLEGPEQG